VRADDSRRFEEHLIEWDDEKVSRLWSYYSRTAPFCDGYFAKSFGSRILDLARLPLKEPIRVLDFGCGPGFMWEHMVAMGAEWEYAGLDFSEDSVRAAHEKAKGHQRFSGVRHVTKLPAPWDAGHFDAVLLVEVVEHLSDRYLNGVLRETNRLLKRGGVVVISTPNEEDLAASTKFCPDCGAIFHEWQHVRTWSVLKLAGTMKQHGFELRAGRMLDVGGSGLINRLAQFARKVLGYNPREHVVATFHKL
jgi:2-polyprenyl-3-methyl-5-hydroxy-6-metoxy-1,4-benzoquinol methylase